MKLSIVIPCYNEEDTIRTVLSRVRAAQLPSGWDKEIIIVDDGSKQETKEILKGIEREGAARVFFQAENCGKGSAIKQGFSLATGDYIVIQDADLEYDPDEYGDLLVPIIEGKADAVFGSRVMGKNNVSFSSYYFYGGLMVAKVFNLFFRTRFSDITTCYKVFAKKYVPELVASPIDDFVFDAVILTHVLSKGRVVEVPITYKARSRHEGKKLNWRHGLRSLSCIVWTRFGLKDFEHSMDSFGRIARFVISGGAAAIVNLSVLYLLTRYAHVWYLYSSIASFLTAFAASFVFYKYWTFQSREAAKIRRQLPLHLAAAVLNLGLNTLLVYVFVQEAHLWYILAQVLATAIISVESYFLFRKIFR